MVLVVAERLGWPRFLLEKDEIPGTSVGWRDWIENRATDETLIVVSRRLIRALGRFQEMQREAMRDLSRKAREGMAKEAAKPRG
jgi:hypothetical protein